MKTRETPMKLETLSVNIITLRSMKRPMNIRSHPTVRARGLFLRVRICVRSSSLSDWACLNSESSFTVFVFMSLSSRVILSLVLWVGQPVESTSVSISRSSRGIGGGVVARV